MVRTLMAVGLALLMGICCVAQEGPSHYPWLPSGGPDRVLNFGDICIAKGSPDQHSLLIAKPVFQTETRTKVIYVTKYRTETRTREVVQPNGESVTQTYTVQVPYTEAVEQTYTVQVPFGATKFTVPMAMVRAWNLSGEPVDPASLARRLAKPTYVIASESDPSASFRGVEPFYASVLRTDTIVIYVAPGALTVEAPEAMHPPAPAAVFPVPVTPAPVPVVDPNA